YFWPLEEYYKLLDTNPTAADIAKKFREKHTRRVEAERRLVANKEQLKEKTTYDAGVEQSEYIGDNAEGNRTELGKVVPNNITFSQGAVKHSNIGDFPTPGNPKKNPYPSSMSGGGHGQANIDYLEKIGMKYNIEHTFDNGVRVGNIPQHKHKIKKRGLGQSWFPEKWTETDIKAAGEYVVSNTKNFDSVADGVPVYGTYNNVRVGVIKTNGQPATVFPDGSKQPSLTIKDFWEVITNK
ncbi:EndoU domain-containing protein, partial [Aliikangiella maris]